MAELQPDALASHKNSLDLRVLQVTTETDTVEMTSALPAVDICEINVGNFADGRGFSMASLAARTRDFNGRIRIIGDVIPDQVEAWFRCGADEVILNGTTLVATDSLSRAGHPRYQHVLKDRPEIDTMIPGQRLQHCTGDLHRL